VGSRADSRRFEPVTATGGAAGRSAASSFGFDPDKNLWRLTLASVVLLLSAVALLSSATKALAADPVVTIDPNPTVSPTGIQGSGMVDPGELSGTVFAEYTTDPGGEWTELENVEISANAGSTPVSYEIEGLKPGTQYYVRLDFWTGAYNLSTELPVTTEALTPPTVSLDPPTFTATSAHFSGHIDPNAPAGPLTPEEEELYEVHWHFECTPACPGLIGGTIGAGGTAEPVEADASALLPSTLYQVRLIAKNAGDPVTRTSEFTTLASRPTVETMPPTALDGPTAWLTGSINPNGQATNYYFEYGSTTGYGRRLPASVLRSAGSGQEAVVKSLALNNLPASTTFHYRIVATNATGTEVGQDVAFTTGPAEVCGNGALREEQGSTYLPDCRAYELVSPAQKFGYQFGSQLTPISEIEVSASGERMTYSSYYPLPPAEAGSFGGYSAIRQSFGWSTTSLFPAPGLHQIGNGLPGADMSLRGSTPDGRVSVYLDSTTEPGPSLALVRADGSRATIAMGSTYGPPISGPVGAAPGQPWFAGISADGKHVIFADSDRLLPGLPTGSEDILYEWEDSGGPGTLRVVDRDDGATLNLLNSEGAELGASASTRQAREANGTADGGSGLTHAVSSDGRRVFFQSPAPTCNGCGSAALYLREDARTTTLLSSPEPGYTPANPPTDVRFLDAAADGHVAYFWANGDLTSGSPSTGAIYSYEADSGALDLVGGAPEVSDEVTSSMPPTALASEDGSHLFYERGDDLIDYSNGENRVVSQGLLVQGGPPQINSDVGSVIEAKRGIRSLGCPSAAATPDGRYFVFSAREGQVNGSKPLEVYRYDAWSGAPVQVLTPRFDLDGKGPGANADAAHDDSGFPFAGSCSLKFPRPVTPRLMSSDGSRVFFSSAGAYAAGDNNNTFDAYEWHEGQLSLLSSGTSAQGSYYVGTGQSGRDALFVTSQPLVGWDTDQVYDLYDARIEGGLPEPADKESRCEGEACQSTAIAPVAGSPASSSLNAADRPSAHKQAKKKKKKRKKAAPACKRQGKASKAKSSKAKSKRRCLSRKLHKHHKHKASTNGKAAGQGGSK
jgi:hypothetical protein